MSDWLNSWTKVRRLPATFQAAKRFAMRVGHAADLWRADPHAPKILPMADSMYILRYGKKAWREMKACADGQSTKEDKS